MEIKRGGDPWNIEDKSPLKKWEAGYKALAFGPEPIRGAIKGQGGIGGRLWPLDAATAVEPR